MQSTQKIKFKKLLESATEQGELTYIFDWVRDQNLQLHQTVQKIPLSKVRQWSFCCDSGCLRHESGRFFSIDGIRIDTNVGGRKSWSQPIINQPEIGILGFIAKEISGLLHFLVQAKIEPGNINGVQLSPTLQATKSNYQRVHGGCRPAYLEYFQDSARSTVLLDQIQSEQGARFLKKRNRNIVIDVESDITIRNNYIWLTLWQLKQLMRFPNLVNMDSKTVLSGLGISNPGFSVKYLSDHLRKTTRKDFYDPCMVLQSENLERPINSEEKILSTIARIKSEIDCRVTSIALNDMNEWRVTDTDISREDGKYFRVIGVDVSITGREVTSWCQPMIEPAQVGICAFITKVFNGTLHLLVQIKFECGIYDLVELAPTVQTLTGDYRAPSSERLPYLSYILNASDQQTYYDSMQSEEGGRFYREQNRNMIVAADSELPDEPLSNSYIWISLGQLRRLIKYNNYVNIQARNLLAVIEPF